MNLDTVDYLSEVRVKMGDDGLPIDQLKTRYRDKSVAYNLSVADYIKMLRQRGLIEEREDRIFFKKAADIIPQNVDALTKEVKTLREEIKRLRGELLEHKRDRYRSARMLSSCLSIRRRS